MQVAFRMQMDRTNTVSKFYELGMTDPMKTKESLKDALSEVGTFDFFTESKKEQNILYFQMRGLPRGLPLVSNEVDN
jgi:hypothetical protein